MKERTEKLLKIKGVRFNITKEGLAELGVVLISTCVFVLAALAISAVVDIIDETFGIWLMRSDVAQMIAYGLCLIPVLKVHERLLKITVKNQ
jgi:hypothetical protein